MPNYLEALANCFPEAQAYVVGDDDPNVYANLIWLSTPIPQATIDSSTCVNDQAQSSGGIVSFGTSPIFNVKFSYNGNVQNRWLELADGINTDETQYIIPFASKLISITFSNECIVDCDIKIYKSAVNDSNNKILLQTLSITQDRTAYNSNLTDNINLSAGDKVAVYIKKTTNDRPRNIAVFLYFQLQDNASLTENYESFSGDF